MASAEFYVRLLKKAEVRWDKEAKVLKRPRRRLRQRLRTAVKLKAIGSRSKALGELYLVVRNGSGLLSFLVEYRES